MADQIELVRNGGPDVHFQSTSDNQHHHKSGGHTTANHEITLGTDQDPYNKPELVNTLKGRELGFFVIFYIFAVTCIVMAFEFFKPVFFTSSTDDYITPSSPSDIATTQKI